MLLLINPDKKSNMKQNTLKVIGAIILLINISLWGYKNYNDIDIGRYVPIVNQDYYPDDCGILDTKTGVIYLYLKKITGLQKGGKYKFKYEFIKINPIDKKITITKAN
jgi:hypothetical protein